ncbi:hypothetical protein JCM18909_2955 [Cutibacterium acnes JCM 18909]|nr:hypothetical protein JCM18909_2955 [Cutibacterium acnes JCM 18909]
MTPCRHSPHLDPVVEVLDAAASEVARPKPRCHGELSGTKRCCATAYDDALTRWIPQLQQPPVTSTTSSTVKDSKACDVVYPSWTPLRPPKNLQMSLSTS